MMYSVTVSWKTHEKHLPLGNATTFAPGKPSRPCESRPFVAVLPAARCVVPPVIGPFNRPRRRREEYIMCWDPNSHC